jgi:hypothetical protein
MRVHYDHIMKVLHNLKRNGRFLFRRYFSLQNSTFVLLEVLIQTLFSELEKQMRRELKLCKEELNIIIILRTKLLPHLSKEH